MTPDRRPGRRALLGSTIGIATAAAGSSALVGTASAAPARHTQVPQLWCEFRSNP